MEDLITLSEFVGLAAKGFCLGFAVGFLSWGIRRVVSVLSGLVGSESAMV